MGLKQSILYNGGMRRDLDVSREDGKYAYENFNIRITASDNETLLAVSNERGNVRLEPALMRNTSSDGGWALETTDEKLVVKGTLIGYGVLNNHIVLFTHSDSDKDIDNGTPDRIIRITYSPGSDPEWSGVVLLESSYGFSNEAPIETLCDFESEDVQKVYWTDGVNQPRMINISDNYMSANGYWPDKTHLDFVSEFGQGLKAVVEKVYTTTGSFSPGCVQYVFTYSNKFGQQSNIALISPMYYTSPYGRGGSPEETVNCSFNITVSGADPTWDYVNIYRIWQTSESGVYNACLVVSLSVSESSNTFNDNGANVETVDAASLLYVGGRPITAYTMCAKDGTLFLGNLGIKGLAVDDEIVSALSAMRGDDGKTLSFEYDDGSGARKSVPYLSFLYTTNLSGHSIPLGETNGYYPYVSQLDSSSDAIRTFKAGEKYRIGVRFTDKYGSMTSCYWIADVDQRLYPVADTTAGFINKACLQFAMPASLRDMLVEKGFVKAELMMAQVSAYDRSVAAQGIVLPTLFRLEDRLNNSPYNYSSWYARARGGSMVNRHFSCLPRNDEYNSEIQCTYENATPWCSSNDPFDGYAYKAIDIQVMHKTYWRYKVKVFYCTGETVTNTYKGYPDRSATVSVTEQVVGFTDSSYHGKQDQFSDSSKVKDAIKTQVYNAGFIAFYNSNKDLISHLVNETGPGGKLHYGQYIHLSHFIYDDDDNTRAVDEFGTYITEYTYPYYNYVSLNDQQACTLAYEKKHIVSIDGLSSDSLSRYCSMHKNSFFVDETNVTFHSPEITADTQSLFQNAAYKLRIVGMAKIRSNITDYDMEVEDKLDTTCEVVKYNLSSTSLDSPVVGLITFPFYASYAINAEPGTIDENPVVHGTGQYTSMYIYPFQKTGSITKSAKDESASSEGSKVVYAESGDMYDNLVSKTESNLRYCAVTDYIWGNSEKDLLAPWTPPAGMESVVCFTSTEDEPKLFGNQSSGDIYSGNYDIILSCRFRNSIVDKWTECVRSKYDDGYLIYDTGLTLSDMSTDYVYSIFKPGYDDVFAGRDDPAGWDYDDWMESYYISQTRGYVYSDKMCLHYDPVRVSVKSTPHAVLSFKNASSGSDGSANGIVTLPDLWLTPEKAKELYPDQYNDDPDDPDCWTGVLDGLNDPLDDQYGGVCLLPWEKNGVLAEYDGLDTYAIVDPEQFAWNGSSSFIWAVDKSDDITVTPVEDDGDYFTAEVVYELGSVSGSEDPYDAYLSFMHSLYEYVNDRDGDGNYTFQWEKKSYDDLIFVESPDGGLLYGFFGDVKYKYMDDNYAGEDERHGREMFEEDGSRLVFSLYTSSATPLPDSFKIVKADNSTLVWSDGEAHEMPLEKITYAENNRIYVEEEPDSPYYFIAELYTDYDDESVVDNRYGGTSENAVENNVFIPLGNATYFDEAQADGDALLFSAYSGDTYFQRWDCQKTCKYSDSAENNINEFVSVMVETYHNIEGRYDLYRGFQKLGVCDPDNTNLFNTAYDNLGTLFSSTVLDDKYTLDDYSTQLTWSLGKTANADTDNWTNITLASTLDMDGSKGAVRALRMINNSIICFQDRAVSQVAFNERAQISTENGVPVELANSGKVDGKRIISDSNGCANKWSIAQTASGLYFIDDIRKSIVRFGEKMDDLATSKGFSVWCRELSSLETWVPDKASNFRTFYDFSLNDIYFSRGKMDDERLDTLCFSEILNEFSTFRSMGDLTMLDSVGNRLVAARTETMLDDDGEELKTTGLWLQGEGLHDCHFGEYQDFYVAFRAAPDPLGDKIFTGLEYRADMFDVTDGGSLTGETFDRIDVWDEYQSNSAALSFDSFRDSYPDVRRKFRIWRTDIPRDAKGAGNPFGLNRMRNPWLGLKLTRMSSSYDDGTDLRMDMHDLVITYYE